MHNKKRRKMKVLVACEFSGIVRDAFIAKGYNAISCDLSPTEKSGPHIQADHDLHLLDIIKEGWDLMIAHPPCTRLCVSGVMWLEKRRFMGGDENCGQILQSIIRCANFQNSRRKSHSTWICCEGNRAKI